MTGIFLHSPFRLVVDGLRHYIKQPLSLIIHVVYQTDKKGMGKCLQRA